MPFAVRDEPPELREADPCPFVFGEMSLRPLGREGDVPRVLAVPDAERSRASRESGRRSICPRCTRNHLRPVRE